MNILIENIGKSQDLFLISVPKEKIFWCCEENLQNTLKELFPEKTILKNKSIKVENKVFRPDYSIPDIKIAIDFQGDYHYLKSKVVYNDSMRRTIFERNFWRFIEIPYFVQLTKDVIEYLFGDLVDKKLIKDFSNGFPHGFIHPASGSFGNFCLKGLEKAKDIIDRFPPCVKKQCFESLEKRSSIEKIPLEYYNPFI